MLQKKGNDIHTLGPILLRALNMEGVELLLLGEKNASSNTHVSFRGLNDDLQD